MERTRWYKDMSFYQIWPRSFKDGNGDGIGDLWGVYEKLDYIKSLNVDGIWFSPLYPSPNADFGYDVMDYTIKYKGETLELIGLDMTVDAVKNDKGVIGYEIYMEMLSSEPIQYNVTVFAPIESTETVEIEINNMVINTSSAEDWGWIFCDGYNDEWELNAGIDAYVMGFEMAEGTYKGQEEVMFYLTNTQTEYFTEQLYAEVVVTNDPKYGWVLTFESLCTDYKTYKVTMKKEVPAATDTVAIRFNTSANAAYYPWLDNDLLLAKLPE